MLYESVIKKIPICGIFGINTWCNLWYKYIYIYIYLKIKIYLLEINLVIICNIVIVSSGFKCCTKEQLKRYQFVAFLVQIHGVIYGTSTYLYLFKNENLLVKNKFGNCLQCSNSLWYIGCNKLTSISRSSFITTVICNWLIVNNFLINYFFLVSFGTRLVIVMNTSDILCIFTIIICITCIPMSLNFSQMHKNPHLIVRLTFHTER